MTLLASPPVRDTSASAQPAPEPAQVPAVSIRKSVTPDYLVCLEDGKKFKTLRRHLQQLGLTPEQYRAKWKLPLDYPMVAPNYSAKRSDLARSLGLGRKPGPIGAKGAPGKTKKKVVEGIEGTAVLRRCSDLLGPTGVVLAGC